MTPEDADALVEIFTKRRKAFSGFMNNVIDFFKPDNESLFDEAGRFVVHSVKSRIKDANHLREKLIRKDVDQTINAENFLSRVTDLCGVRILHLRRSDFSYINAAIKSHVEDQNWSFAERPKAYTWDPEYNDFFESQGIQGLVKESSYTSVHYLVRPNDESSVICEIQVRSLFEEIWGEIDHDLNYPTPSSIVSCTEQLKVLAKLVGAGSRLVDSIYRSLAPEEKSTK